MFKKFAEKVGEDVNHLQFLFDGFPVSPQDTALSLELENGYIIDVLKIYFFLVVLCLTLY